VAFAGTGVKPESKPGEPVVALTKGSQGLPKLDCETVWFPAMYWKLTISPTSAWTLSGVNVRLPPAATWMTIVFAAAMDAVVRVKRAALKNIVKEIV